MTPVEYAIRLHENGFKVFPLVANGKKPLFEKWQHWATNATVEQIAEHADSGCNWGVYCGESGVTVVDLDTKRKNKNGIKTFEDLQTENGVKFPETLTVRTPSGGLHLYYKGDTRTTAGKLGPGVDTRSIGGYVVAPGSVINSKTYEVIVKAKIQPLPPLLNTLLEGDKPKVLEEGELVEEGSRNDTLSSLAGTMRARGMSGDAILAALHVVNDCQLETPLPVSEVERIASSISRYAPEHAKVASDFLETPKLWAIKASEIDGSKIPKRDWIMQRRYIGRFISVIVSPGGIGKSILSMLDAAAIATGQPLSGFEVPEPAGVWLYNTEDPSDELKRRMLALAMHYRLPPEAMARIFITSGREIPLILAKRGRDGLVINKSAIEGVAEYIKANNIKVMIVDPFVRAHEVSENDNMEIDKVVWCFQRIADKTGCAIGVIHHTRKASNGGKVDMDSARGASALVNAARVAHVLQTMSSKEANQYGIGDSHRSWYMRLDNAKANLQPPADAANWFKKISVSLPNGDDVGVIENVSLIDKRDEKRKEAILADARDIAVALAKVFEGAEQDQVYVTNVYQVVAAYCPHLFDMSDRRGQERLIAALLSDACKHDGVTYGYECSIGDRTKHIITRKIEDDFLD